jgi:hypothetical protein
VTGGERETERERGSLRQNASGREGEEEGDHRCELLK